jgi:hypothetical protein
MSNIYITHCSAKKDDSLKNTGIQVTPDRLYTSTSIRRFMDRCKQENVKWAIFSDHYGIWFPHEKHEWYDKHPSKVTKSEYRSLVNNFDNALEAYNRIFFYHNPGRFHKLYEQLIQDSALTTRIILISHLDSINAHTSEIY